MKVNITLKVDFEKKKLFESLKHVHGKTFSDALDEGLDETLLNVASESFIEMKIKETETELEALKKNLSDIQEIKARRAKLLK